MRIRVAGLLSMLIAGVVLTHAPGEADAFCGFYVSGADSKLYNNATQVALLREGRTTVLSMRNNYQGPPEGFAMVVPVPVVLKKENVKTLSSEVFERLDSLSAPRLVEYWEEDPCAQIPEPEAVEDGAFDLEGAMPTGAGSKGVKVEAQFDVGEYNVVILSAKDSTGLESWLTEQKYAIPEGAAPHLRPYVESGSKFFVAKVDPSKVAFKDGQAMLSPLRFHYDSEEFSLPVRLGLMNAKGKQDLLVYLLARGQRYETANYPNVTIPTNINVKESVRESFGEFYAALFDNTLEKTPKAVVTEYSWDAGSCDPCPQPPLTATEIATLGGDVLGKRAEAPGEASPMAPSSFVLTRLHARYSAEDLGEDLVFKAASPIVGGREFRSGDGLESGARSGASNAFQGRYAIRHEWEGAIDCPAPRRGVWGGPPRGVQARKTEPATDLAFAKRGGITLANVVAEDIPAIGLVAAKAAEPAKTAAPTPTAQAGETSESSKKKSSKGCSTGGSTGGLGLVLIALGILWRRKESEMQS